MPSDSDILRFGELRAYKEENETLKNECDQWRSAYNSLCQSITDHLQTCKEEKSNLNSEISNSNQLNSNLTQELQILQEQAELFAQERNTLNDQIKKLDAKVLEAESNELVLQTKISNLEDKLLESQTKEIELLERISKSRDEMQNKSILFVSKERRFLKIIAQLEQYKSSLESKIAQNNSSCSSSNSNHLYESTSISEKEFDDYMNSEDDVQSQSVFMFDDSYNVKDIGCLDDSYSYSYSKPLIELSGTSNGVDELTNPIKCNKEKNGLVVSNDKLPSILGKPPQLKVMVPKKLSRDTSSKPFTKKISQFTTYSLQKARKYVKKQYSSGTITSSSFLSFSDNSVFISKAKSQLTKSKWKPILKVQPTESKSFKYSISKLLELAPKSVKTVVQQMNDFVSKNHFSNQSSKIDYFSKKINDFSPLRPRKIFQKETSCFHSPWNATSIHRIDETIIWLAKAKTVGPVLRWVPKVVLK